MPSLAASRSTPSCVLVALAAESDRPNGMGVAAALRKRGIPCEVAPAADKFGKQIKFAERRGIPFVWFTASADQDSDSVKDIRSGAQAVSDASSWMPPAEDLWPRVIS